VLAVLGPAEMEKEFVAWVSSIARLTVGEVVAIDPAASFASYTLTAEDRAEPDVSTSLPLLTARMLQPAYSQCNAGALEAHLNLARTWKAGTKVLIAF